MYYVLYSIVYGFSLLPFWMVYGFSDILFVLVYYVIRYRRDVVMQNLSSAFPEKTETERKHISRKFYRNFIDNFLEAIKLLSMKPKVLDERFKIDYSLLNEVYAEGKSCQILLGHTFNWEYANAHFSSHTAFRFLVVYMPIGSPAVDRIFRKLRERFGTILLPATDMRHAMLPFRNQQYALALVADQNPGRPERSYWCNFLGMPAPFVKGPERGGRLNNIPSIFVSTRKVKRGKYAITLRKGIEEPLALLEGEATLRYVRFLENEIREQPEIWLWTHRRWKFTYQAEYAALRIDD